jgi:hypothetical protein
MFKPFELNMQEGQTTGKSGNMEPVQAKHGTYPPTLVSSGNRSAVLEQIQENASPAASSSDDAPFNLVAPLKPIHEPQDEALHMSLPLRPDILREQFWLHPEL